MNIKYIISEYKLYVLFVFLNIIDLITTYILINGNKGIEANALPSYLLSEYGFFGLLLLKTIGLVVVITIITKSKLNKNLIAYPCGAVGIVVIWNLIQVIS